MRSPRSPPRISTSAKEERKVCVNADLPKMQKKIRNRNCRPRFVCVKAASVMLGRRNVCCGNEGLKTQQQSASSAIRSSHSLPHSLTRLPLPADLGALEAVPLRSLLALPFPPSSSSSSSSSPSELLSRFEKSGRQHLGTYVEKKTS